MKTTVELPDDLFRQAKATAASRGSSLKNFLREALEEKLGREGSEYILRERATTYGAAQPGRSRVGALQSGMTRIDDGEWPYPPDPLGPDERQVIEEALEEAFEQVNPETWK